MATTPTMEKMNAARNTATDFCDCGSATTSRVARGVAALDADA
ncbi:MAG: hypothetical protein Q8L16_21245 [Hydrogenophaga sp.]|nr:hypothetical protein [Hydrogenophaga sp.]